MPCIRTWNPEPNETMSSSSFVVPSLVKLIKNHEMLYLAEYFVLSTTQRGLMLTLYRDEA